MNIKTKKNGEWEIRPSRGMTLIVETDLGKVKIKEVLLPNESAEIPYGS